MTPSTNPLADTPVGKMVKASVHTTRAELDAIGGYPHARRRAAEVIQETAGEHGYALDFDSVLLESEHAFGVGRDLIPPDFPNLPPQERLTIMAGIVVSEVEEDDLSMLVIGLTLIYSGTCYPVPDDARDLTT